MRYYKVFMAGFFGLVLVGINVRADDVPVIDLNTLPDDSASFSTGLDTQASTAPDVMAARQSLPMTERVRLLEQQINNLTQMNLPGKVDGLEQQINQLNGRIEEQTHIISQLQDQQKQPQQDLISSQKSPDVTTITEPAMPMNASQLADETGIKPSHVIAPAVTKRKSNNVPKETEATSPSSPIAAAETAVVQNKPATQSPDINTTVTADSDEKAYQAAFDLMMQKKNTAAITGFKIFLKNYPNSTVYTPSAHYWLGELYSAKNMTALASKEFNTVVQQYPTHTKVSDAMLKLAIIHDDAGQHAQAKQELQKVIKQFPDSTAAKLAKMRLQSMK